MKNLLTKTLFISLLLSATIPSGIQAGWTFNAKESLVKSCSDLADFRTSFKETTVGLSKQAREKSLRAPMLAYQSIPRAIEAAEVEVAQRAGAESVQKAAVAGGEMTKAAEMAKKKMTVGLEKALAMGLEIEQAAGK